MSYNFYQIGAKFVLSAFCILSMGGIVMGMMFGVMKSPQSQANDYLALAQTYKNQALTSDAQQSEPLLNLSNRLARTAISFAPYDQNIWQNYEEIKSQTTTPFDLGNADIAQPDTAFIYK